MLSFLLFTASFTVPFGHGPAQVGLTREAESSPEAPGSLAVDAEGRSYILDAVNQRVAVYGKDRSLDATIALPSDTVEDIALLPNGDLVALDRLVDRRVFVIAPNGAIVARAWVEGDGVEDGGEVTAVFADSSGVWLEVLHGAQVRVIDGNGRVDAPRVTRPGVPMGDQFVRLRKVGDGAQVLFFDKSGKLVADGAVSFSSLLELSGLVVVGERVYVAGHELVMKTPESRPTRDVVVVAELERKNGRLTEKSRHVTKASPEWVPLKQLVRAGDGVAHLFVDSTGSGIEVTSW